MDSVHIMHRCLLVILKICISMDINICLNRNNQLIMTNLDSTLKSRDITLPTKGPSSQGYGFSSSHVWMWELNCEESWVPKNWCFWTVVSLDWKEIQPVHPKGDKWVFIPRIDAEAEGPVLWPPDSKNWLIGKDPDAGKDWGQEEKGTTEDRMAGWHHQLDGREFEWTSGVGNGQGGLACCDSWSRKESDTTEWLNWTELRRESTGQNDNLHFYCVQFSLLCWEYLKEDLPSYLIILAITVFIVEKLDYGIV